MESVNHHHVSPVSTPAQEAALAAQREAHRLLYNAALEQRKAAWTRQRVRQGYAQQCKDLPEVRQADVTPLPAQAAQHTLKRVGRAFQAFFPVLKAGPRAWAIRASIRAKRFQGLELSHPWGWLARAASRGHAAWAVAVGWYRACPYPWGCADSYAAGTCDIVSKHGRWYASVVLVCQPVRARGVDTIAFDWGVETFATIASLDSEPTQVNNPRFLRQSEARLKAAYRARDTKKKLSHSWRLANKRVAQLHSKIARQRLDFHHQHAAQLVDGAAAIFTEKLQPANLTRRPQPKKDRRPGSLLPTVQPRRLDSIKRFSTVLRRNSSALCDTKRQKPVSYTSRLPAHPETLAALPCLLERGPQALGPTLAYVRLWRELRARYQ